MANDGLIICAGIASVATAATLAALKLHQLDTRINLAAFAGMRFIRPGTASGGGLMEQRSSFGLAEQLEALSGRGDPLEVLDRSLDFEDFRGWLVEGLGCGDGS